MKLKITAFKKSGKYYAEEIFSIGEYPSLCKSDQKITISELRENQATFCFNLWLRIKNGEEEKLSPTCSGFKGMIFVFEALLENSETGFMSYLLDRTGDDNEN